MKIFDDSSLTNSSQENSRKSRISRKSQKSPKDMSIKIDIPEPELLKPKITIFGVGGAGGNALNNMIRSNLEGVEFVAANTDAQALSNSLADFRIQLGLKTTRGLGAGSFPDRGKIAAEENIEEIEKFLEGSNMVFIAAGMGGGTGTGAAPVIAKLARERDILTVGVITKPFHFEGKYRMETAESGIEELKKYVDTLIVIPNQNLFRIANETTTFESAFKMADDVLHAGVRGVTDLITMPGLVNLDFADIRTIMTKMGKAMMGTGEASGENRAILACEAAISNPLLDDISIKGAKGVLVNMTGGPDMTLFEADLAVNSIRKEVDPSANIIFGSAFNEDMEGRIRISVVATGIDSDDFRIDNNEEKKSIEPSRFRISLGGGELKGSKTFYDPGIATKPVENKSKTENHQNNFNVKNSESNDGESFKHNQKSYFDEESSSNIEEFSFEDEDGDEDLILRNKKSATIHQKEQENRQKENPNSADSDEELFAAGTEKKGFLAGKKNSGRINATSKKIKKESGGFSLFSFMNNAKKQEEELEVDEDFDEEFPISSADFKQSFDNEKLASSKQRNAKNSQETIARQKKEEFFGKSTVFDEDEEVGNNIGNTDIDDDVVNVPAFFRRKKS